MTDLQFKTLLIQISGISVWLGLLIVGIGSVIISLILFNATSIIGGIVMMVLACIMVPLLCITIYKLNKIEAKWLTNNLQD